MRSVEEEMLKRKSNIDNNLRKLIILAMILVSLLIAYLFLTNIYFLIAIMMTFIISFSVLNYNNSTCLLIFSLPFFQLFVFNGTNIYVFIPFLFLIFQFIKGIGISKYILLGYGMFVLYSILFFDLDGDKITRSLFIYTYTFTSLYLLSNHKRLHYNSLIYSLSIALLIASIVGLIIHQLKLYNVLFATDFVYIDYIAYYRFAGLFNDANFYSMVSTFCIASIFNIINSSQNNNLLNVVLLLSLTVVSFFTLSKSFLLTVIVIYIVYFIIIRKMNIRIILILCCILVLVIASESGNMLKTYMDTLINRLFTDYSEGDLTTGRMLIWRQYWQSIINGHPFNIVFGHGINALELEGFAAHNSFIQLFYLFGIFGLGFYILQWVIAAKQLISFKQYSVSKLMPLVVILVQAFFLSTFTFPPITFLLAIFMLQFEEENRNENNKCYSPCL